MNGFFMNRTQVPINVNPKNNTDKSIGIFTLSLNDPENTNIIKQNSVEKTFFIIFI